MREPVKPPKHSRVPVVLRGDHPYSGKEGWIPMTDGVPETVNMFGNGMVRVNFDDGTGCYAEQHHVQTVSSAPAPRRKS